MKVSIVVQARFHAFNMARYFQNEGVLNEIITGYPAFYVKRFGINPRYIKSVYINEVINRAMYFLFKSQALQYTANEIFDFISSLIVKRDSDVYFIWSGCGLRTIRKIRKINPRAIIILVRCSGHIEVQEHLLKQVSPGSKSIIDKRTIKKELLEYEAADYITLPSTFAFNSFREKNFSTQKLFLNRYGVDLSEFPFYLKPVKQKDELVLGYVGALSKRKNISALIQVVDNLVSQGKKIKLILVGAVDYESFDANLLVKHEFIDYRGRLAQGDLHEVYAEMDVFVLNSIEEGLAYVQMQAMSCGLPIISTTNAGGLDLVQDGVNGFTIPILDNQALEEKISWFYDNQDKIAIMGEESRKLTEEGFTWEDFGQRNIDFLNQVISTK